jgi:hypothetical protein
MSTMRSNWASGAATGTTTSVTIAPILHLSPLQMGMCECSTAVSRVYCVGNVVRGEVVECSPYPVGAAAGMGKKAGTKSNKPNICTANTAASRQEARIAVPMLALPHI